MSRALRTLALVLVTVVAVVIPARSTQVMEQFRSFCGKAAALAHAHRGLPVAIAPRQVVGPWDVSLWASPDVGTGMVYVVLVPREGTPFVAPRSVHVNLRAASDAGPGQGYEARPEPVSHGARFAAAVALDHADTWQAHIVIDGASGPTTIETSFASSTPASLGAAGAVLSAAPFLLVAGLWGRGRRLRRRVTRWADDHTPVTLTRQIVT